VRGQRDLVTFCSIYASWHRWVSPAARESERALWYDPPPPPFMAPPTATSPRRAPRKLIAWGAASRSYHVGAAALVRPASAGRDMIRPCDGCPRFVACDGDPGSGREAPPVCHWPAGLLRRYGGAMPRGALAPGPFGRLGKGPVIQGRTGCPTPRFWRPCAPAISR
jgi:hypothetical protein